MPPESSSISSRGELERLIRTKDWSATPLGPPSSWPPSLHTVLRLMLTSRYPMWMGWGPDLTLFYNDEYASQTLGPKHPAALGRPVREVWSEIWPTLNERIEHVLATGEATWDEGLLLFLERNGYPEETYHTFSYSPAPGDGPGQVGGLFCVVIEETERVIGERRIALLRDFSLLLNQQTKTVESAVFSAVDESLSNARDSPFALTYLFEDEGKVARLVSRTTMETGHPAAPGRVAVDASSPWPLLAMRAGGAPMVVELDAGLAWPKGPWERPPSRALVVPIAHQGHARPAGVFIAGLNPHRPLDGGLRSFVELFVGQLAAALSNARAYGEERRRAEALAELDRAKTLFFSNVSHEFRTPLTLMLGPSEEALADADEPLGPRQRQRLELVHRSALRLGKLVNSLLDFARIEAGRAESSFVATDLAVVTRELASVFQSAVERAGLRFDLSGIEDLPDPVYVDRDQWEKIVLNLISNALKFTFEGSIRVSLRPEGDDVELEVADTGIGVAADEMPRLFERFHRIRGARSRTHEGTGIGLALVQELARLHGGTVRASSEPGKGTSFVVRIKRGHAHLPAARIDTGALPVSPSSLGAASFVEEAMHWLPDDARQSQSSWAIPLPASLPIPSEPRARVLIADDNGDMRNHLSRLLSARYEVEAVADGVEALRAVKAGRPDLVLTDMMMPNMDGLELLGALRRDEATRDLPVVMLSARAGEEGTREGLEAGADDYLVKPFSARELAARVDAQISRGRLRAAEAAHRRYITTVFESAPVGIAILHGPEHVFAFANARYLALLPHKKASELVGSPIRSALPELEGQGIYEILDNTFRSGEAYFARSFRLELPRGENGAVEDAFFEFEYQPIRDERGAIEGIVVVVFEVTELARARSAAEAANKAKDEFLAMLGHELRNPLAPIMTSLELMSLRGTAPRERMIIDRQVRHVMRLVDDLLDVSRITSEKVSLSKETLDLAEVIADAIETASPMLEQQSHHLRVTAPPGHSFVHGDRARLTQVVANLVTNAAKYTDPGGELEITTTAEEGEIVLRVRDNGQGLAPDLLPRVFDLFAQGTRTIERAQGGLGLGLAIVKSLVGLHGGTVSAESEGVGLGSVFTVRLPSAAAPESVDRHSPDLPASSAAVQGLRVLVVDDNEDGADMLSEALSSVGHVTRVAYDGPEAIKAASAFRPDVALIDIGLPVMDGFEVAKTLRTMLDPSAKLIAVTGYGQTSDRARTRDAGFDHHLVKPVELTHLIELLERGA
jgi:signal transduction histidine kinase/DNA-binding response OmpR family regulator